MYQVKPFISRSKPKMPVDADPGIAHFVTSLVRKGMVGFLLFHDDQPIGTLRFLPKDPGCWLLRSVSIASSYRGKGLCRNFLSHAMQTMEHMHGMTHCILDVAPGNAAAIRCYLSQGFGRTEESRVYEGVAYARFERFRQT